MTGVTNALELSIKYPLRCETFTPPSKLAKTSWLYKAPTRVLAVLPPAGYFGLQSFSLTGVYTPLGQMTSTEAVVVMSVLGIVKLHTLS